MVNSWVEETFKPAELEQKRVYLFFYLIKRSVFSLLLWFFSFLDFSRTTNIYRNAGLILSLFSVAVYCSISCQYFQIFFPAGRIAYMVFITNIIIIIKVKCELIFIDIISVALVVILFVTGYMQSFMAYMRKYVELNITGLQYNMTSLVFFLMSEKNLNTFSTYILR